jgi:glutathione S-transferase
LAFFFLLQITFNDIRIDFATFNKQKSLGEFPFGSVPVLDIDGIRVCESNAILRFVGKLTGLYPSDPVLALRVDEILDVMEDVSAALKPSFSLPPEEKADARRKLIAEGGAMHKGFALLARRLASSTPAAENSFFVNGQLSIADLKVLGWRATAATGFYDGIPADWIDSAFPALGAALARADAEVANRKAQHSKVKV